MSLYYQSSCIVNRRTKVDDQVCSRAINKRNFVKAHLHSWRRTEDAERNVSKTSLNCPASRRVSFNFPACKSLSRFVGGRGATAAFPFARATAVSPWLVRCIRLYPSRTLPPPTLPFLPSPHHLRSRIRVLCVFRTPSVSPFPPPIFLFYRAFLIFPLSNLNVCAYFSPHFVSPTPSPRLTLFFTLLFLLVFSPLAPNYPFLLLVAEAENTSSNLVAAVIVSRQLSWLRAHAPWILKRSREENARRPKRGLEWIKGEATGGKGEFIEARRRGEGKLCLSGHFAQREIAYRGKKVKVSLGLNRWAIRSRYLSRSHN